MPDGPDLRGAALPEFDLASAGSYRFWTRDVLRWGDTDGLGHINNVQFARFCESGRIAYLTACGAGAELPADEFVIAHLAIDFRAEMHYPGEVDVGTRVMRLGRSSVRVGQGLFQNRACTATAEAVVVHLDSTSRRAAPLPEALRARLLDPPV